MRDKKKLKIGCDIHGVIDANPIIFSMFSKMIVDSGGEFHIITGGSWTSELEEQLKGCGIKWTSHFSVYDYLIDSGIDSIGTIQFPDGTIQKKFDYHLWDTIKAGYCKSNNIDLHIDDTEVYSKYFTTPFLLYKSSEDFEKISHIDIRKHM